MIDSRDKAKIRLIKINEATNQPVPQQYIGKGYMKGEEKILVSPELIASCLPPVSNQVVFDYFLTEWDLPYMRVETFYHVMPVVGEELNYAYMLKMLADLNLVAIGQATFQNCCNIFALASLGDRLIIYKLRFDDQIVQYDAPLLPALDPVDDAVMTTLKGFALANTLGFDLSGFRDSFNDNFLAAVSA